MIQVRFKNLEKSELAMEATLDRVRSVAVNFADLRGSRIVVTLEMEDSPAHAGPDLFNVTLQISRGRFNGTSITKTNSNLYKALSDLSDQLFKALSRADQMERVKPRKKLRKLIESDFRS